MSMRNALLLITASGLGLAMASAGAIAAESPNLGRVATPEEIASWDDVVDGARSRHRGAIG